MSDNKNEANDEIYTSEYDKYAVIKDGFLDIDNYVVMNGAKYPKDVVLQKMQNQINVIIDDMHKNAHKYTDINTGLPLSHETINSIGEKLKSTIKITDTKIEIGNKEIITMDKKLNLNINSIQNKVKGKIEQEHDQDEDIDENIKRTPMEAIEDKIEDGHFSDMDDDIDKVMYDKSDKIKNAIEHRLRSDHLVHYVDEKDIVKPTIVMDGLASSIVNDVSDDKSRYNIGHIFDYLLPFTISFDMKKKDPKIKSTINVSCQGDKCGTWNVKDNAYLQFIKYLDEARLQNKVMNFSELQANVGPLFIDLDIYQKVSDEYITSDDIDNFIKDTIHPIICKSFVSMDTCPYSILVRKKSKVMYAGADDDKYKYGIHIFIFIKMDKKVRAEILKTISETIIDRNGDTIFHDSTENQDYIADKDRINIVDPAARYVPVLMFGNCKQGKEPYVFHAWYRYEGSSKGKSLRLVKQVVNDEILNNLTREFSIRYNGTCLTHPNMQSLPQPKPTTDILNIIAENESKNTNHYNDTSDNISLDTLSFLDPEIDQLRYILLNILPAEYADNYYKWSTIMTVLASREMYKELAYQFSKRWDETKPGRFNDENFEKDWAKFREASNGKHNINTGLIYHFAHKENPEEHARLIETSGFHILLRAAQRSVSGYLAEGPFIDVLACFLPHKYVTDNHPTRGNDYVWWEFSIKEENNGLPSEQNYKWIQRKGYPQTLIQYVSEMLYRLMTKVIKFIEYKNRCKDNSKDDATVKKFKNSKISKLKKTCEEKLQSTTFRYNIIKGVAPKFQRLGFASKLDQVSGIIGVGNGVLKLYDEYTKGPVLINTYHRYPISRYTSTSYIPYDENNHIIKATREILLSPFLERNVGELVLMMIGNGLNNSNSMKPLFWWIGPPNSGKSEFCELILAALGEYSRKVSKGLFTKGSKGKSASDANSALMDIKGRFFIYFSETKEGEGLAVDDVKEIISNETLTSRGLFQSQENFKNKSFCITTSNVPPVIKSYDPALIGKRMYFYNSKVAFVDKKFNDLECTMADNKITSCEKIANTALMEYIKSDEAGSEYREAILSILVHYNNVLRQKYNNNIFDAIKACDEITKMTDEIRQNSDRVSMFFIDKIIVSNIKGELCELPINDLTKEYALWLKSKGLVSGDKLLAHDNVIHTIRNSRCGKILLDDIGNINTGVVKGIKIKKEGDTGCKTIEEFILKVRELKGQNTNRVKDMNDEVKRVYNITNADVTIPKQARNIGVCIPESNIGKSVYSNIDEYIPHDRDRDLDQAKPSTTTSTTKKVNPEDNIYNEITNALSKMTFDKVFTNVPSNLNDDLDDENEQNQEPDPEEEQDENEDDLD